MFKSVSNKFMIGVAATLAFTAPVFAQSPDWQRQVARVIAAKQTYPRTAQMRGEEGTARVKIYIAANGAVEKTELVGPSGSSTLDREALSLPGKVGNLPAPPGGATSVVLPFTWKLL